MAALTSLTRQQCPGRAWLVEKSEQSSSQRLRGISKPQQLAESALNVLKHKWSTNWAEPFCPEAWDFIFIPAPSLSQVLCASGIYRLLCLMEWEEKERGSSALCFPCDSIHLWSLLPLHEWVLKPEEATLFFGRGGRVPRASMRTAHRCEFVTHAILQVHTNVLSVWVHGPCAGPHSRTGLDHSDKNHRNHSNVLLTQNFTRKKAFWGPFPNSSFKPPFFSGNLS